MAGKRIYVKFIYAQCFFLGGGGFCVKSTNFMDFNINHQVSTANYCVHNSLLASPIREVYQ